MMTINKSNVVLVIVVVAALAVASVVAVHGHGGSGDRPGDHGASKPGRGRPGRHLDRRLLDGRRRKRASIPPSRSRRSTSSRAATRSSRRPRRRRPAAAPRTPTSSRRHSSPTPTPVAADINVKGGSGRGRPTTTSRSATSCRRLGSVFEVTPIQSGGVTFELLGNYTLGGNLEKTFEVAPSTTPTEVSSENGSKQVDYTITVLQIDLQRGLRRRQRLGQQRLGQRLRFGLSGSSSGPDELRYVGHSIKALSIETHNGVPSATIVVDGTTFAARKVGAVITTRGARSRSWASTARRRP